MKHVCPHCREKSFTPWQKARCHGMSSAGKPCMKCGRRCVNGKDSLAVHTVLSLIGLGLIIYNYFTLDTATDFLLGGVLPFIAVQVLGFVYDMFFGKLIPAIKIP